MKHIVVRAAVIAAMIAASAFAYDRLPNRVPMQYGLDGKPNWYGPTWIALIITPIIALIMPIVLSQLPRFDPRTRRDPQHFSYEGFRDTLTRWSTWLVLLLAVAHGFQLAMALGVGGEWPIRLLMVAVGLLFMAMSNEFGRLRPNSFAGIRMPWLMNNPEAWRLAHRFAGRLWFIAAAISVVCALVLPIAVAGVVLVIVTLGAVAISVVQSYRIAARTRAQTT